MAVEVIFPRVDMDMTTGRIGRWLAGEGSPVRKGDPLFEIETDKAAMEIEAPVTGTLRGLRAADGEEVAVGTAIAWIVPDGEAWQAGAAPEPDTLRATPLARHEARRLGLELSSLKGSGPNGRIGVRDLPARQHAAAAPDDPPVHRPIYRQWLGAAAGTPLVFLHGFGSDRTGWRPVWNRLEATHRILAIDLPGHGRSAAPAGASFATLVDAVRAVLDEEGVGEAHLVGHSLGGAVALALAGSGATAVRSLCLLAPAGLGPEIDGAFLSGLARAEREESLAPWLRRLFADPELATPAFVRAAWQGRADPGPRAFQRALLDAVFPDGTQALELRPVLRRLAMPAKVIWGVQDAIIPIRHAALLPGAIALHTLPCGHMPQLEAAPLVATLVAELARSAAGPVIGSAG